MLRMTSDSLGSNVFLLIPRSREIDHRMRSPPMLPCRAAALAPMRCSAAPLMIDPSVAFYELQLTAESLVANQLQAITPLSILTLYGAGLLTSLTPCCLSQLPPALE